jgi:hypothetical protein
LAPSRSNEYLGDSVSLFFSTRLGCPRNLGGVVVYLSLLYLFSSYVPFFFIHGLGFFLFDTKLSGIFGWAVFWFGECSSNGWLVGKELLCFAMLFEAARKVPDDSTRDLSSGWWL